LLGIGRGVGLLHLGNITLLKGSREQGGGRMT